MLIHQTVLTFTNHSGKIFHFLRSVHLNTWKKQQIVNKKQNQKQNNKNKNQRQKKKKKEEKTKKFKTNKNTR